jgi:L-fuculose-phosphate aldolase
MARQESQLRHEIVRVGRLMYEKGLISSSEGNISALLGSERILITPSGVHKGFLEPAQLLIVDHDGQQIGARVGPARKLKPTSELPLHLEVYKQRKDISAVVHAHPPITIALSIARIPMAECLLPEVIIFLGLIPTAAYATPGSAELASSVRQLISSHDALVLERHGSLTTGSTPMEGFMRLEIVEQNARISFMLAQLGSHEPLPPNEVEKLLIQRKEMGLCKPGESTDFCQKCGVCHVDPDHLPTMKSGYKAGTGSLKGFAGGQDAGQLDNHLAGRGLFGGPQSLPPIRARSVGEDEIRELVRKVVKGTIGQA